MNSIKLWNRKKATYTSYICTCYKANSFGSVKLENQRELCVEQLQRFIFIRLFQIMIKVVQSSSTVLCVSLYASIKLNTCSCFLHWKFNFRFPCRRAYNRFRHVIFNFNFFLWICLRTLQFFCFFNKKEKILFFIHLLKSNFTKELSAKI